MHTRLIALLVIPFLLFSTAAYSKMEDRKESFYGDEFKYLTVGDCAVPTIELQMLRSKLQEYVSEAYYYEHFDLDWVHARDSVYGCGYQPWHWVMLQASYNYKIDGYSFPYYITMEWDEQENEWQFTDFTAPRKVESLIPSDSVERRIRECVEIADYQDLEYHADPVIRMGFSLLYQGSSNVIIDAEGHSETRSFSLNLENGVMEVCAWTGYLSIARSDSPIALYPAGGCHGGSCIFETNISVNAAYIYPQKKLLSLEIPGMYNEVITVQIPRKLIDAKKTDHEDGVFAVMLDGNRYSYKEIETTETHRTLMISWIPAGTKRIDILGTQIIQPEKVNATVAFDKPWYKVNDRALLTVIDPSINPKYDWTLSNIDTVQVRIWTSVDEGGMLTVLRETSPESGIFQEIISWTIDRESDRLPVEEGGTITAKYNDLTTSAKILGAGPLSFGGPLVAEDRRLGRTFTIGDGLKIEGFVSNKTEDPIAFLYIVQTKDSNGFTTDISTTKGWVQGKLYSRMSLPWKPGSSGDYEVTVFLWSDLDKPIALADYTISYLTLVSIDSHTAIKTAIDEDRWTEQALNAVNLREHFYFLKANGELYGSDPYSRTVGDFLRIAPKPTDGKDHFVWGVSLSPRLSAIDASWFYFVDDSNGKLVAKECIKISCDELGKIIQGHAEFPTVYSYHAEYNFNDVVGVFPMQSRLANTTISHRLESEVHCTENSTYGLHVAASVTKLPSVSGYNYRSNIYYSDITNVMDVFLTDPTHTRKSLDQAVIDRIFRNTGNQVTESDFKQENGGTWHYVLRNHPVQMWTNAREDIGRLVDKHLSGACVWEEHEFGHIHYASFYTVLNQDIMEGDRKIGEIRLFVNEAGLMEISILSEKEVDPKRAIVDLFTKADLPLIHVSDIKFEYSKSSKPS